MKSTPAVASEGTKDQIAALVRQLHDTQQRLQELAGSELDAVLHPDGQSYLLHHAQESLRKGEIAQRQLAATQSSILNALPAHIALIDEAGVILSVNEGWQNFSATNGLRDPSAYVGQNYLEICDRTGGESAQDALAAAEGIRAILSGERTEEFLLEYPCHSPTEQRWFLLRVNPLEKKGLGGAVVMHVNITKRKRAEDALRASEASLAVAQGIAHFGSWELDLTNPDNVEANALRWSDEMFRIAGYEPGSVEISNEFFFSLVPKNEHAVIRRAIASAIRDRLPYSVLHRLIRPNGEERYVQERGQISYQENTGQPSKILGTAHDVTERRSAEIALEESQARHRSLFENMLEGYTFCQILYENDEAKDYIYLEVNGVFEAQTGLKNVVGRKVSEVVPGMHEANPEQLEIYSRVAATGKPEQFETYAKMLDIWFSVSVYSHKKEHFIAVFDNITDRKRIQEALEESEERLAFALESAAMGYWNLDLLTNSTYRSLRHDECFGYREAVSEWSYETFLEHVSPLDRDRVDTSFKKAMADEGEYDSEFRTIWPDGSVHWLWTKGQFSLSEEGKPMRVAGIVIDITKRKHEEFLLVQGQQRLTLATESARLGIWDWDVERDIMIWDRKMYDLYGIRKQDFSGAVDAWQKGLHPEDREKAEAEIAAALAGGKQFHSEFRIVWPNSEVRYIEAHAVTQRRENGLVTRMIGVNWDITERKRGEAALLESEERSQKTSRQLAKVLNSSLDAICTFDAAGNFVQVSAACEKIWGYRPEELLGTPYIEKVLPEDRPLTVEAAARIMAGISTTGFENRYVRKDGSVTDITWSARWSEEDQSMFCVARDDTERKGIEERVIQQAKLIDEARDAIIECDLEDRITFWNRGAERLFGWAADEVQGDLRHELFHLDELKFREANHAVHATGEWNGELQKTGRDGTVRTLDCRWTLLRDAHGEPRSVLSIDTDITERKKIENQFLRAQRMESIGTLAGGIAHDLNNALGPVIMSVELLAMRFQDPESQNLISIIGASAQRGADMVRQVLSFARGVEGERVETDIKHLIHDIEKIARDTFLKHITVRTIITNDLWTVVGDPTQIHQVLLNLCVNARDAMPEGGALIISAENCRIDEQYAGMNLDSKPGSYVVIKVEDTGSGIPPAVIEKIFEPFFTTKELGKGTGLGLSTSIAIVKSHGGFIRVYSEPGKGTKFQVHFPANTEGSAESAAEAAREMPRGNGELILVVDDESSVRLITQQTLEAFGYRVVLACDGTEAVAVFAQQRGEIAVVLTDMMMPVMDGAATIHALNKMSPGLPIIAASGLTENSTAAAARLGIRHFLSKPYTAPALLKVLQEILSANKVTPRL